MFVSVSLVCIHVCFCVPCMYTSICLLLCPLWVSMAVPTAAQNSMVAVPTAVQNSMAAVPTAA